MSMRQLKARCRLREVSGESSDNLRFGFNEDWRYSDSLKWSSSWTRL